MNRRNLLKYLGAAALAGSFPLAVNAATLAQSRAPRIVICGAGRFGCRMLSHYVGEAGAGVAKTVGIDTSAEVLDAAAIDCRLHLPDQVTDMGSAGPSGAALIATHRERIAAAIADCDLLIVVAGLGGRAGAAVALEAARIARENGVFVAAVPILPFGFELQRVKPAKAALQVLRRRAQLVVPVFMQSIAERCGPSTLLAEAVEAGNQLALRALADILERARRS